MPGATRSLWCSRPCAAPTKVAAYLCGSISPMKRAEAFRIELPSESFSSVSALLLFRRARAPLAFACELALFRRHPCGRTLAICPKLVSVALSPRSLISEPSFPLLGGEGPLFLLAVRARFGVQVIHCGPSWFCQSTRRIPSLSKMRRVPPAGASLRAIAWAWSSVRKIRLIWQCGLSSIQTRASG